MAQMAHHTHQAVQQAQANSGGAVVTIVVLVLIAYVAYRVTRFIRMKRYFASEEFQAHKREIGSVVDEHNEISGYTLEIRRGGTFAIGGSSSGAQAHLASFQNTSQWKYRRDRNVANLAAPNVHNCSLQVVRNASADPLKYVMKYFNVKADEPSLESVENLGESIARLESAVDNLRQRESSIARMVSPPMFILKHYEKQFMKEIGVELAPIAIPYPVYIFEYVSAGGNSSQRTTVTLDSPTIDALISTLGDKIRWRRSAVGQRALMTARLRNAIKARDNYTCLNCSISVMAEPHLLLEVDHIVPISRGGLSAEDNLQTLCWRCNRTKSNKLSIP
jgi:hypothetical protein